MKGIFGSPRLIYAERKLSNGEIERGTFLGMAEFMAYRERGWSATEEINRSADEALRSAKQLQYLAG